MRDGQEEIKERLPMALLQISGEKRRRRKRRQAAKWGVGEKKGSKMAQTTMPMAKHWSRRWRHVNLQLEPLRGCSPAADDTQHESCCCTTNDHL